MKYEVMWVVKMFHSLMIVLRGGKKKKSRGRRSKHIAKRK